MKSKYWVIGLVLVLMLGMVACGHQAEQEPQEPAQEIQQTEPVTTEPTVEPMEVKQEITTPVVSDKADTEAPTEPEVEPEPVEEIKLFEDCNETVYATGTVNIRASYTANSEKLGSLNTGDSVTRTGVAIAGTEAEGWSRIQLTDGSIVYVSSKYLSTTKPVTQSSGNTQSKPTGQPQGGGTTTTTTTPPAGGGDDLSATEQAMMEAYIKAREEAAANGGSVSTDVTTGAGYEYIGSQLNQG